jgi:hypothetical protein
LAVILPVRGLKHTDSGIHAAKLFMGLCYQFPLQVSSEKKAVFARGEGAVLARGKAGETRKSQKSG